MAIKLTKLFISRSRSGADRAVAYINKKFNKLIFRKKKLNKNLN